MPKPPDRRPKISVGTSLVDEPDYRVPLEKPTTAPTQAGDEVDRALAVLHDRHPNALRDERETRKVLEAKKVATEGRVAEARRAARRRWLGLGALTVATGSIGAVAWTQYTHRRDRLHTIEGSLGPLLAPYLTRGFVRIPGSRFGDNSLVLDIAEPSCFVAVGSAHPGDGAIRIERSAGPIEGAGAVAWCSCGAETATVRMAHGSTSAEGGVAVVRAPLGQLGGRYGLLLLDPVPSTIAPVDQCAETSLDAWVGTAAAAPSTDDMLDEDLRATLRRAGFVVAGSAPPSLPFAVIPGEAEMCTLAWSTSPTDRLTLRLAGGARPIVDAQGVVGLCAKGNAAVTVWRSGSGNLIAERVAAGRVGGTHGLARIAPRLGLSSASTWVSDDELDWDAASMLRSTGVLPTEITSPADGLTVKIARVVALSLASGTALPDGSPLPPAAYACDPPLVPSPKTGSVVCVEASPLTWRSGSVGKAGIAVADFPYWMGAFTGAREPRALVAELGLLRLGRRIVTDGFERGSTEGITEEEGGAKVTGLGGRDAIVALQLSSQEPWVSPCTNGDTWTLDGEPAVVSLAPKAEVHLKCTPRAPRDHHTVVFRHFAAKSTRP